MFGWSTWPWESHSFSDLLLPPWEWQHFPSWGLSWDLSAVICCLSPVSAGISRRAAQELMIYCRNSQSSCASEVLWTVNTMLVHPPPQHSHLCI